MHTMRIHHKNITNRDSLLGKTHKKQCSFYLPLISAYHHCSLEPLDMGPIACVTY